MSWQLRVHSASHIKPLSSGVCMIEYYKEFLSLLFLALELFFKSGSLKKNLSMLVCEGGRRKRDSHSSGRNNS